MQTMIPHQPIKLLTYLQQELGLSSRQVKRLLEENQCRLNGRVERFGSVMLSPGDRLEVEVKTPSPHNQGQILFEDDSLLVYNKPSGTTSEALEPILKQRLIHRLDKETTGILLFAKNEETLQAFIEQFRELKVEKEYLALIDGVPKKSRGTIENELGKIQSYQGQSRFGAVTKGLPARTDWELVEAYPTAALIRCFPRTGRTHQIRVHLAGLGHPLLGDSHYGRIFHSNYYPRRHLLHAAKITFTHKGKRMTFEAPLPEDFQEAIKHVQR